MIYKKIAELNKDVQDDIYKSIYSILTTSDHLDTILHLKKSSVNHLQLALEEIVFYSNSLLQEIYRLDDKEEMEEF